MKTRLLIIIAVSLLLLPWIRGIDVDINNQVMVDGIIINVIMAMSITIIFSLVSWVLFAWATNRIKFSGMLLAIITGTSLIIPFLQILGPMGAVIVGVVAGFAAFMLQKKMINPTQNKPLIIAAITIVVTYFVLIIMFLVLQSASNGIGEWSGTADGMEKQSIASIFFNDIGIIFFPVIIPALIITGWVIRNKKK